MAKERTASNLAEFAKFQTIGAAVMGLVTRTGSNQNGDFIELEPAAFRGDKSQPFTRYAQLAVGLSTDLASKISSADVRKLLLIVFVGTKPTRQDPMKLYRVVELEPAEAKAIANGGALDAEWEKAPDVAVTSKAAAAKDAELPF